MSFEQTPDFYDRLTRDQDFRTQVLAEIAADDELKTLTEEDLKAIFGGRAARQQIYGTTIIAPRGGLRYA